MENRTFEELDRPRLIRVGLVERVRTGAGRVTKLEMDVLEMEEEQNRLGDGDRWKWLWGVVP